METMLGSARAAAPAQINLRHWRCAGSSLSNDLE